MAKKSRIIIEHDEKQGVKVKVQHAFSPDHAIWMLSQAITVIVTPEVEENEEELSELPDADGEKEEADVSDVQ